ncbi:type II secretion system F family protein [Microbacterium sp. UBA3394]|uniref:type II secretion system F family protein n=2 Tax=Microbacterium TaxID=33882 RepID=UPI00257BC17B|nr:type II secretion system F family protein [Microbacterium sp. UBA3394]
MPLEEYRWRAATATGAETKGVLEAASESAVVAKLRAQGLAPLSVVAQSKTGLNRDVTIPGFERGVATKDLAVFAQQFAGLIQAGLPLMRALALLAEQTPNRRLASALTAVQVDIESGSSFSTALAAHPNVFPPLMVSLVSVGETGGFLADSLEAISRSYQADVKLQQKIRSAMTYPIIVLVIAVVGVIAMITFVVPVFENMFASMGGELPLPTQVLVTLSHNMVWILPLLIVLAVAGWIWYQRVKHTDRFRGVVDPFRLRMPVFGSLVTKIAVARFARNLSMMLGAGVPLMQALDLVGRAANNKAIEDALRSVRESVRLGRSFSAPLARAAVFPPMVSQMVSVGEESGSLPDMLENIAAMYEAEVDAASEQLTSMIEPIMMTVLGLLIGGMVVALYMPMFTMYQQLGQ